jgi:tetratricopeptide (TPR) repeat protein
MPESVASTSEFIGVCQRLAAYYIALAQKETARGISGYARLDKDRMHYLYLMKNCLQLGLLEDVCTLARAIDIYLDRGGYGTERIDALEMNLSAARLSGNYKDEEWCLNSLGYICERRGEVEKALMYYTQ